MPVIIIGQIICVVATGLLTRLDINTTVAEWASFMVLSGIGLGMGITIPHTAIQAVMETYVFLSGEQTLLLKISRDTEVFIANGKEQICGFTTSTDSSTGVATFFSQLGGYVLNSF